MNKGYLCTDDRVIISDENGNQIETYYCDNLNEILIQENVIEKIESEISFLEKKKKNSLFNLKLEKKIALVFPVVGIAGPLILELLMGINPSAVCKNIFGFKQK